MVILLMACLANAIMILVVIVIQTAMSISFSLEKPGLTTLESQPQYTIMDGNIYKKANDAYIKVEVTHSTEIKDVKQPIVKVSTISRLEFTDKWNPFKSTPLTEVYVKNVTLPTDLNPYQMVDAKIIE